MQLRLDAADRLVELVEERRGPLPADDAAHRLFALSRPPVGLARTLLDEVVSADARLAWHGDAVSLAAPRGADVPLAGAEFVVFDLETTGLSPGRAAIVEIGAVRVRALASCETFQTLVDPRVPLAPAISRLTGIRGEELRGAPRAEVAVPAFLAFAGDAALVAHNARFDLAFLDRETARLTGRRVAAPVVDTVALARRLLAGRATRFGLAALSFQLGTAVRPCHRALPDAQACAEVLLHLIGLAQERGAQTVADLSVLAGTRRRRAHDKRLLAFGAPPRPGVYLFRDRTDNVLYVGRARDLRARLRSYFRSERLRPAVEAALGALERIEWRETGSELEAALEELRLLRELRPPANARDARPDRYVYLRARGADVVCSAKPGPLGPLRSRSRARLAARALRPEELDELLSGAPLLRLQARLRHLAESLRYEDAARVRDRVAALESVLRALRRLERLRAAQLCLVVPAREDGYVRAYFVAGGRVAAARTVPAGAGARVEVAAGLAAARHALADQPTHDPEAADELLLVATFLRRPPPELVVAPLDLDRIVTACARGSARAA